MALSEQTNFRLQGTVDGKTWSKTFSNMNVNLIAGTVDAKNFARKFEPLFTSASINKIQRIQVETFDSSAA